VLLEINEDTVYHIIETHDPISKTNGICVKIWNRNISGFEKKEYIYCSKWQIYNTINDPVTQNIKKAVFEDKLFGLVA
jgi:hypothetical protein